MKLVKTLFLGLCALGLAATAQAQTVIRITGSTAYRSQTHAAIQAILSPGYTYAHNHASSLGSASLSNFVGTVTATGDSVIIKCGWSGSVDGVRDVSTGLSRSFYDDSVVGSTGGTANVSGPTVQEQGDVAMSDSYQGSTLYTTPTMNDQIVGIIPFRFFASTGSPLTNINAEQAQQLYAAGDLPLSFFTGNPADHAARVYAAGRDNLSGTRVIQSAVTGIGVFSSVNQYTFSGSGSTLSAITGPSNGGVSGSTLASYVRKTLTGSLAGSYIVAYMGGSDATAALAAADANGSPAIELTYQGYTYSTTNVQEGKYPYWAYQHLMYLPTLSGVKKSVADTLANQIKTADAVLNGMQVSRPTDGGLIAPTF